ncbi:MAG: DUF721 domain-containing protein [Patescibacteria group bacterium]
MERLSSQHFNVSLARAKIKPQVEASKVLEYFETLLIEHWGKKVTTRVKPLSLVDGTLRVAVLSSVLAGEVRLREHQLLKKINQRYGQPKVTKIALEI